MKFLRGLLLLKLCAQPISLNQYGQFAVDGRPPILGQKNTEYLRYCLKTSAHIADSPLAKWAGAIRASVPPVTSLPSNFPPLPMLRVTPGAVRAEQMRALVRQARSSAFGSLALVAPQMRSFDLPDARIAPISDIGSAPESRRSSALPSEVRLLPRNGQLQKPRLALTRRREPPHLPADLATEFSYLHLFRKHLLGMQV